MDSGLQSGKYQAHLDRVLPQSENIVTIGVPMNQNRAPLRTIRHVPVQMVFDSLQDELEEDATIMEQLRLPADELPDGVLTTRRYCEHNQVAKAAAMGWDRPIPLALYVDGVTFKQAASGRSDTTLGVWLTNLLTGSRYLVACVRDSDTCDCGCRGWCTIWPILNYVRWMLLGMQDHCRPANWVDGTQYDGAGARLSFNACLVWVKGDMAEHSKTLGLASHSQFHAPCVYCTQIKPELHVLSDTFSDAEGCPWELRSHQGYFDDCSKCEIYMVVTTEDDRTKMLQSLGIMRRGRMNAGMAIIQPIGQLEYGDRLEPSEALQDTHALRSANLPLTLTFWRPNVGSVTRLPTDHVQHRCPVFDERLHSSPAKSLAVDELHCIHLGQIQRVVSAALWRCLLLNPLGLSGTQKAIIDQGMGRLWTDLQLFQEDPANDIRPSDMLGSLTMKMIGQQKGADLYRPNHPGSSMSVKGGEAALLLKFACWELEQLGGIPSFGSALVGAVLTLQSILDLRRDLGGRPSQEALQRIRAQVDVHIRCCKRAGIALIPKSHQILHLIDR